MSAVNLCSLRGQEDIYQINRFTELSVFMMALSRGYNDSLEIKDFILAMIHSTVAKALGSWASLDSYY